MLSSADSGRRKTRSGFYGTWILEWAPFVSLNLSGALTGLHRFMGVKRTMSLLLAVLCLFILRGSGGSLHGTDNSRAVGLLFNPGNVCIWLCARRQIVTPASVLLFLLSGLGPLYQCHGTTRQFYHFCKLPS